jgi:glutamine amidotransferase
MKAAIVDYGLGNLFSIKHACAHVGVEAVITSSAQEMVQADWVILPGVGAFGDAMAALNALDLISPLKEIASSDKTLFGICLGMQLLMTESWEFGRFKGLGIIEGEVVKFNRPSGPLGRLKVPQIGWNRIYRTAIDKVSGQEASSGEDPWAGSPLQGLGDGEFMYFVHSYYVKPEKQDVPLSVSSYGDVEFCSSLRRRNIFASQFHPERSGSQGIRVYQNLVSSVRKSDQD